eukprot:359899-Chlamydomonas_euryale.AAC.3
MLRVTCCLSVDNSTPRGTSRGHSWSANTAELLAHAMPLTHAGNVGADAGKWGTAARWCRTRVRLGPSAGVTSQYLWVGREGSEGEVRCAERGQGHTLSTQWVGRGRERRWQTCSRWAEGGKGEALSMLHVGGVVSEPGGKRRSVPAHGVKEIWDPCVRRRGGCAAIGAKTANV